MKFEIDKFEPCDPGLDYYNSKSSAEQAWNDCDRGDWMLWIAAKLDVDLRTLTLAKALCAKTVLPLMKDERSVKAVEVAEKFGRGLATIEDLADAYAAASASVSAHADAADAAASAHADAYAAASASASAHAASAHAAAYADAAAYAAYASASAASAHADAASAHADAADAAADEKTRMLSQSADICREVLTDEVFKKVVRK